MFRFLGVWRVQELQENNYKRELKILNHFPPSTFPSIPRSPEKHPYYLQPGGEGGRKKSQEAQDLQVKLVSTHLILTDPQSAGAGV